MQIYIKLFHGNASQISERFLKAKSFLSFLLSKCLLSKFLLSKLYFFCKISNKKSLLHNNFFTDTFTFISNVCGIKNSKQHLQIIHINISTELSSLKKHTAPMMMRKNGAMYKSPMERNSLGFNVGYNGFNSYKNTSLVLLFQQKEVNIITKLFYSYYKPKFFDIKKLQSFDNYFHVSFLFFWLLQDQSQYIGHRL